MPEYAYTTLTIGLEPIKITVEVDSTQGVPNLIVIGLASKGIDEARERITAALLNCGISPKARRTILNLAPAEVRKDRSSLELAMCVGLLKLYKVIETATNDTAFFGELSLDGSIKPITGALPLVQAAKQLGFTTIILPTHNLQEVQLVQDVQIYGVGHLNDLISHYQNQTPLQVLAPQAVTQQPTSEKTVQLSDVIGQETAKRALVIAAAGGHNVLLIGPPGSGKSMLAEALCSILPPLSEQEALEVTTIHSIAGLTKDTGMITQRPFRAPHHTTSAVGLLGGGLQLSPGEVSLAHHGVLFLDEFPEFSRTSIEALRQPLQSGDITITRAHGTAQYPAQITLIAAANPCPCGYFGSSIRRCRCSTPEKQRYQSKVSGPILDRIDMVVPVQQVHVSKLSQAPSTTDQSQTIASVQTARTKQTTRSLHHATCPSLNAFLSTKEIKQQLHLAPDAKKLLDTVSEALKLSARAYFSVIKVAQTITDLDPQQPGTINMPHIREALSYRNQLAPLKKQ